MKKNLLLTTILIALTTAVFAQKPVINFKETSYDFGTVSEEDKKVSHIFEFTNDGTSDLVLTNVRASCGCTTPQWSREPIAPKAKGTITVTYRAAGRPGAFTKSITVNSNADRKVLIIKGNVTPKGKKVEDVYKILKGSDLRLKSESVGFGDVAKGDTKSAKLPVANISDKDITISFTKLPKGITAKPLTLKAGKKGNVTLEINTAETKDWGNISESATYTTSKAKGAEEYTLKCTANIFEKFTAEQKKNAPKLELAPSINLGEIVKGSKKTFKIALKNNGVSPLYIRSTSTSFNDISIKAPKKGIAPGKSANLKVTVSAKDMKSSVYNKYITIQTNDPSNAKRNVALVFTVKDK